MSENLRGDLLTYICIFWLGPKVNGHLALFLHSSREPDELSPTSKRDVSTIKIILVNIVIITNTS